MVVGTTAHLFLWLSRQEQMLGAKLPKFRFDLCVLENSISVLYQFPLLTGGVDGRINLACSKSPINIMINIIQPCASLPRANSRTVPQPFSQERP